MNDKNSNNIPQEADGRRRNAPQDNPPADSANTRGGVENVNAPSGNTVKDPFAQSGASAQSGENLTPSGGENPAPTDNEEGDSSANNAPPEKGKKRGRDSAFIAIMCVLGVFLVVGVYGLITNRFKEVMSVAGSILLAVIVLLVMITVHEFGHFITGRLLGFGITEFAIGFGPVIYKRKGSDGRLFTVRALPIGGFCAFEGEDDDSASPTAFNNRKPWQRIIVLVAGAAMNFLLAILLIALLFGIYGQSFMGPFEMRGGLPQENVLQEGDVVVSLDGRTVYLQTDIVSALKGKKKGETVTAEVIRGGKETEIEITLASDVEYSNASDVSSASRALGIASYPLVGSVSGEKYGFKEGDAFFRLRTPGYDLVLGENGSPVQESPYYAEKRIYETEDIKDYLTGLNVGDAAYFWLFRDGTYYAHSFTVDDGLKEALADGTDVMAALGITSSTVEFRWQAQRVHTGFFRTLAGIFAYAFRIAGTLFTILGELITGVLGLNTVGGTVTTVIMTGEAIRLGGFSFLLEIAAYIGVNLAVFNLLPIPALDGSRVVFTLIEMIFRKPVPKKIEAVIHTVGLVLLLGFAVLVDVLQLF